MDELTDQLRELCRVRVRGWTAIAAAVDELTRLRDRVAELESLTPAVGSPTRGRKTQAGKDAQTPTDS